ncbi:hypothetical protein Q0590_24995 [Rhodocytophaga aerolata]|uniref:Uncharacterized protein n=1 Tax=Rhodocytophaga aerolata TaxID=455078 RepID=A0ABT8REC2_9BACT|nr:hypothetical protein [Rhodocytophaga aerolata]MDO1449558.1 hypothetical protein [Rhodocytophaga aerolata]
MIKHLTKTNILFTLQLVVAVLTIIWLVKQLRVQKSQPKVASAEKSYIGQ